MSARWSRRALLVAACAFPAARPASLAAQRAPVAPAVRSFVKVDTNVLALTNVRVIDGTGAAPRERQTVVIRDGNIAAMGATGSIAVPAGAQTMDMAGKSIIPGLVMVHEHLYYPVGAGTYGNLTESFSRLYLAGGVTSMRTGGNMNGFAELLIAKATAAGQKAGPWIDATEPYLEGAGMGFNQVQILRD